MKKKVKKRNSNRRPIIRITADHMNITDIVLSLTALFVDVLILVSIWVVP